MKPTIYVIVNKSLRMSPGKVAAQVGHAVAGVMAEYTRDQASDMWLTEPHRWLIVLEAKDGEQLHYLTRYLGERLIQYYEVIDEGVNEIPPFSLTAVGVEILDKDSEPATWLRGLSLYSDERKFTQEQLSLAFQNGAESRKWRYRFRLNKIA